MKKCVTMTVLVSTLLLTACKNGEEQQEEQVVVEDTPVAVNQEKENTPYMDKEAKVYGVDQSVSTAIQRGHTVTTAYTGGKREDFSHLDEILEDVDETMEAALVEVEDPLLEKDLEDIAVQLSNLQTTAEEQGGIDKMDEVERESRLTALRGMFRDLDYFVRGVKEYHPPMVTRYANHTFDEKMKRADERRRNDKQE